MVLQAVGVVDCRTGADHKSSRFGGCIESGRIDDQICRHTGELFGFLRGKLLHIGPVLLEAGYPVLNKAVIKQSLFDDHMCDAMGQGSGCPRAHS